MCITSFDASKIVASHESFLFLQSMLRGLKDKFNPYFEILWVYSTEGVEPHHRKNGWAIATTAPTNPVTLIILQTWIDGFIAGRK